MGVVDSGVTGERGGRERRQQREGRQEDGERERFSTSPGKQGGCKMEGQA